MAASGFRAQAASQRAHRKMREIADEVVLTGALEEPAAGPRRRQRLPH